MARAPRTAAPRRAALWAALWVVVAESLKMGGIPSARTSPTPTTVHEERMESLRRQRSAIDAELAALETEMGNSTGNVRPRDAIRSLYKAFNDRDAPRVASLLAEDVVYEDLLLGASTICRGRESFQQALAFHPAFVSAQLGLPMGRLELVVDDVACDGRRSVGVEWHVELNGEAFPLSRGLSLATINEAGELQRVVDIAEAPWRVVGLAIRPLLSLFGVGTAALGAGSLGAGTLF